MKTHHALLTQRPKKSAKVIYQGSLLLLSALGLLILSFGDPAEGRSISGDKQRSRPSQNSYAPFVYHTRTMQCPYPDVSNVTVLLASTKQRLRPKAANSLKNCLEPQISKWTAMI